MKTFAGLGEAKIYAERTVRELARGDQSAALVPKQATDVLAIRAVLAAKLGYRSLAESVKGYLQTVVTVQRKDLAMCLASYLKATGGNLKSAAAILWQQARRPATAQVEPRAGKGGAKRTPSVANASERPCLGRGSASRSHGRLRHRRFAPQPPRLSVPPPPVPTGTRGKSITARSRLRF
jgi:hypothetical protein